MIIAQLISIMDEMFFPIIINNLALIDDEKERVFKGVVDKFKRSKVYSQVCNGVVTSLYTLGDGTLVINYYREEET